MKKFEAPSISEAAVFKEAKPKAENELENNGTCNDESSEELWLSIDAGNDQQVPLISDFTALIRRLDRRLIWLCILIYLTTFLNRVNVANIQAELVSGDDGIPGLTPILYSTGISVFFVGDILSKVPSNLMLRRFGPRCWFAVLLVLVGLTTVLSSVVIPSVQVWIVVRGLVGIFQGGCFPGLVFYLTQWYQPQDCGYRYSLLFSASLMASATSGLLASLIVNNMNQLAGLRGWQWLLCIEGVMPLIVALLTLRFLPNPGERRNDFLDESEQLQLARYRGKDEHTAPIVVNQGNDLKDETEPLLSADSSVNQDVGIVRATLLNGRLLLFCVFYYFCCVPNAALQFFLPIILQSFGLTSDQSNWLTVPVYMISAVFMIVICTVSDRRQTRPRYIIMALLLAFCGFAGLTLCAPHAGIFARQWMADSLLWPIMCVFFALCASLGTAPVVPLACSWVTLFVPTTHPTALAISSGMMVMLGQLGGIVVPYVYAVLSVCRERVISNNPDDSVSFFGIYSDFATNTVKTSRDYSWAHGFVSASLLVGILMVLVLSRLQQRR